MHLRFSVPFLFFLTWIPANTAFAHKYDLAASLFGLSAYTIEEAVKNYPPLTPEESASQGRTMAVAFKNEFVFYALNPSEGGRQILRQLLFEVFLIGEKSPRFSKFASLKFAAGLLGYGYLVYGLYKYGVVEPAVAMRLLTAGGAISVPLALGYAADGNYRARRIDPFQMPNLFYQAFFAELKRNDPELPEWPGYQRTFLDRPLRNFMNTINEFVCPNLFIDELQL